MLLAWLALHPGSHARRELAGRFWPDIAEDAARANLRSALTELRQGLGIASRLLAADRKRVALTGAWVDAPAFAELAIAGRLAEAEALCRSELLAGVDDELVYAACAEHERRLAELLARLPGAWTRNAVVGDFRSGTGRLSADGLDRRDTPPLAGKAGVPIVLEQTTGLDDMRSSPSSRPSDSRFACVSDSAC